MTDILGLLASKSQWELFLGALNMVVGVALILCIAYFPFYWLNKFSNKNRKTKNSGEEIKMAVDEETARIELEISERIRTIFDSIEAFKNDLQQWKITKPDIYKKIALCKKGSYDNDYQLAYDLIGELKALED